ncbi:MAG: peptidase M14, partial [Clostridiales bacterium]|nr:peptidase M14 [Clostridiales bacterium]
GARYWQFVQDEARRHRDNAFAAVIAKHIGVKKVDGELDSAGGYKDWCVQKLGIPAVTIELIKRGNHPFEPDDYKGDIKANADLPTFILDYLYGE